VSATYSLYYIFGKYILPRYAPQFWLYPYRLGQLGCSTGIFRPSSMAVWLAVTGLAVFSPIAYQLYYAGLRHIEAS
jgi:drug/metabolite transporter (DMT)-like permease